MLRSAPHPPRGHLWSAASTFQQSEGYRRFAYDDIQPPPAYDLDSGVADSTPAERAARRRRIETLANDLIDGKELFISSARSRGLPSLTHKRNAVDHLVSRNMRSASASGAVWEDVADHDEIIHNAKRSRRTRGALQEGNADADYALHSSSPNRESVMTKDDDETAAPRSKRARTAKIDDRSSGGAEQKTTLVPPRRTRRMMNGASHPLENRVTLTAASTRMQRQSTLQKSNYDAPATTSHRESSTLKHSPDSRMEEAPKISGSKRRTTKRKSCIADQDVSLETDPGFSNPDVRDDASAVIARFRSSAGYGAQFASTYIEGGEQEEDHDNDIEKGSWHESALSNGTAAPTNHIVYHTAPEQTSQQPSALRPPDPDKLMVSDDSPDLRRANPLKGKSRAFSDTKPTESINTSRVSPSTSHSTPIAGVMQPSVPHETLGATNELSQSHIADGSGLRRRSIGEIVRIAQLSQASESLQSAIAFGQSSKGRVVRAQEITASPTPEQFKVSAPSGFTTINPGPRNPEASTPELEEKGYTPPPMNEEQASMMGSFSIHDAAQPSAAAMSMLGLEYGKNKKLQRAKATGAPSVSNPGRPEGWVPCHPGRGPMSQNDPRRAIDPKLPRGQQQRMTAFRIELSRPKPLYTASSPAPNDDTPFKFRRRTVTPEAVDKVSMSHAEHHEVEKKDKPNSKRANSGTTKKKMGRRVTYPSAHADDKEHSQTTSRSSMAVSKSTPSPSPISVPVQEPTAVVKASSESSKTVQQSRETSSGADPTVVQTSSGRIVKDAQGNNVIETPIPVAKPFVEMELDFNDSFGRDLNIALNEQHVNSILKDRGPGDSAAAVRERLRRELLMSGAVITDTTSQASVFPMYDPNSPVIGKYRAMINKSATSERAIASDEENTRPTSDHLEGSNPRSLSQDHASEPSPAWPGTQILLQQAQRDLMSSPVKPEQIDDNATAVEHAQTTSVASTVQPSETPRKETSSSAAAHGEPPIATQQMIDSWSPWSTIKRPRVGRQQDGKSAKESGKSSKPTSSIHQTPKSPGLAETKFDEPKSDGKRSKRARRQSNLRFSTTVANSSDEQKDLRSPEHDAHGGHSAESYGASRSPLTQESRDEQDEATSSASGKRMSEPSYTTRRGQSAVSRDSSPKSARALQQLKDDSQLTQTMADLAGTVLQNRDMDGVMSQIFEVT